MIEGASSLTMSVPNIITSSPSGGRFDFDDGGTYCGGWQDGKAHGHGVCTGPKNVGEYSGSWNFGFEMSGVYKWTNGAVYEGRWQNGKRHGVGVEYNGKWIYKGEWSQGLKGRYGVKASSNSAVKYEGTWANGLQDGYGSETYSDGGYYQGQMCRGLRHGYGVRKSAPYGDSQLNNPNKNGPLVGGPSSMLVHSNSMQSSGSAAELAAVLAVGGGGASADDDSPKPEDGFKPNIDRTLVSKNGFVLVAKPLDVPMGAQLNNNLSKDSSGSSRRRNSLTNRLANTARIPNQTTANLLRGLRLKKQKSTSDLDIIGHGRHSRGGGRQQHDTSNNYQQQQQQQQHNQDDHDGLPLVPFTLSPEELDITDPTTVETYTGEWKHDKRNGHGVCERSDGLHYEGQWHNDMKCGYGVTTFKDGSKEEGKYKNNILIVDSKVKRFFQLGGSSHIRQRIDDSVKMAIQAQTMALKKAEIADTRAATARDKADQAMTAAFEANRDSQIAYSVARQYSDSQQQQQQQLGMTGGAPAAMGMAGQFFNQNMTMFGPDQQQQQQQGYLQNLNMAASPLQMRRISQHQQRNQSFYNQQYQNQSPFQQQQQQQFNSQTPEQQQRQQNGQYLGPVEPFNGRRGSFRGGGGGGSGSGSSQLSPSGFYTGGQHQQQQLSRGLQHQSAAGGAGSGPHLQSSSRPSANDPFSDLFDHYKASPSGGSNVGAGFRSRRAMLGKQTSLDQYNSPMRHTSVPPRQLGNGGGDVRRRFRNSSLDHADEHAGMMMPKSRLSPDSINQQQQQQQFNQQQLDNSMQQQFRHLVTSGEQLQHQYDQVNQLHHHDESTSHAHAPTPTGSSYILPHSSGAGSSSAFNASNQTPSPSGGGGGGGQHSTGTSATYYGTNTTQQAPSTYSQPPTTSYATMMLQQQHQYQRDVHSLADEQLYLADLRRMRGHQQEPLDRTEYSNYDFAITSGPRPVQRCRRRTASLSRTASNGGEEGCNASTGLLTSRSHHLTDATPVSGSLTALQAARFQLAPSNQRSASPVHFNRNSPVHQQQQQQQPFDLSHPVATNTTTTANHLSANSIMTQNLSPNSYDGAAASSQLNRKPSLQVRYDPIQLGGLMSREEVAALSHAQREQKRLEAEQAEKRAKRPLLHLCLTLKEFVTRHQLALIVLMVNICLMKMFADLIA